MKKEYAEYLLEKNIGDYNQIAEDYSRTRVFVWDIESLKQYVSSGDRILDLGCGNARLLKIFKDKNMDYVGVDASEKLIDIAKRKYLCPPKFSNFVKDEAVSIEPKLGRARIEFQVADGLNLPFPDNYFDKIFSIRVLHHFPSKELRLQFLKEAKRVLRPKGLLILTVWNVWGCKNRTNLLRLIKSTFLKIIGMSKLDFGDTLIPWGGKVMRYCHYFNGREFKKLVEKSGFKIKKTWTSSGPQRYSDIYVVAEK